MSRDGWRPEPHNRRPQKLPMKVIKMRQWRRKSRESYRQMRRGWGN